MSSPFTQIMNRTDYFFCSCTDTSGNLVLAKYSVSSDSNVANPAQRGDRVNHFASNNADHNGGMLAFGNDGYLY
ncbi:MAG: hypothetical protein U0X92_11710 [Anaerolineales bacterium]